MTPLLEIGSVKEAAQIATKKPKGGSQNDGGWWKKDIKTSIVRTEAIFSKRRRTTKLLVAGDAAEYTMPLLIRASADRWIGVAVIVGVDGGKSPSNIFWSSKWFPLRSAEAPPTVDQ